MLSLNRLLTSLLSRQCPHFEAPCLLMADLAAHLALFNSSLCAISGLVPPSIAFEAEF